MKSNARLRWLGLALVLVVPAVMAQERPFPPPAPPGERGADTAPLMREAMILRFVQNPRAAKALGLTEAQVATLEKEGKAIMGTREKLRQELMKSAMEQVRLFRAEEVDEAALMALVEETGRVRTEIAKQEARGLLLVVRTLSWEQRQQARRMLQQRMERREAGHKGPPPPDAPPPGPRRDR